MRKAGLTPSTKLVQAEPGRPPAAVAEQLGLGDDEQVLIRTRHMFTDGRPAQLAVSYIPLSVAGGTGLAFPDTGRPVSTPGSPNAAIVSSGSSKRSNRGARTPKKPRSCASAAPSTSSK